MLIKEIEIKKAKLSDLDNLLSLYENARKMMKESNNPNQWKNTHPSKEFLISLINKEVLYIGINKENEIMFSFSFIIGIDETYINIEDGEWLNDLPYGTIHALASSFKMNNVFYYVLTFCLSLINNIKIDTHNDNVIMQKILNKYGFIKCGTIYIKEDHSPRIAYQLYKH